MKARIFVVALFIAATLITGCDKDFLEKKDPNNLTTDAYWKTEKDLYLGITAVYSTLTYNYQYGTFEFNWVPTAFRADDFDDASPWYGWHNMGNFTLTNEYVEIEEHWNMLYRAVAQANQVLENVDKVGEYVTTFTVPKDTWKAEARFLRAFAYFNLLSDFRNPVFSDKFASSEADYFKPQPDRSVVWKLVEEDLTFAMNNLPVTRSESPATFNNIGRARAGSAAAYLGKAYLFQNKYSEAVAVLKDIRDGKYGNFSLVPNFASNFDGTNENNSESLFEILYGMNPDRKSRGVHSIGDAFYWRECWPSRWIFDEMRSELTTTNQYDPRLLATIFCNLPGSKNTAYDEVYTEVYADEISAANADPDNNPVLFTDKDGNAVRFNTMSYNKYQQPEALMIDGWRNSNNVVYMRYADVLLMLAEAENELNGPTALAYACIKEVRDRASMPEVPSGLDKAQFRARIMHERAVEFAGENTRYSDLVRWDANGFIDLKATLQAHGKDAANFTKGKHEYLPVPYSEVSLNTNITVPW
jgi:hypothetical protein